MHNDLHLEIENNPYEKTESNLGVMELENPMENLSQIRSHNNSTVEFENNPYEKNESRQGDMELRIQKKIYVLPSSIMIRMLKLEIIHVRKVNIVRMLLNLRIQKKI